MTRPADSPLTWATDANHSAPGEPWDGLATKVVPSAGQRAAGWQPQQEPPAEWTNALLNRAGQWTGYLEELTEPRDHAFAGGSLQPYGGATVAIGTGVGVGDHPVIQFPAGVTSHAYLDLTGRIPRDARITAGRIVGVRDDAADGVFLDYITRTTGAFSPASKVNLVSILGGTGVLGNFDEIQTGYGIDPNEAWPVGLLVTYVSSGSGPGSLVGVQISVEARP